MKLCEYANNLFDMTVICNIMKDYKKIVLDQMSGYSDLLNVDIRTIYDIYMVFYRTVNGHRTYIRLFDLEVNRKLYIEKIRGQKPNITILW